MVKSRKFVKSVLIGIFILNIVMMMIPVQEANFGESDHFFASLLRGLGYESQKPLKSNHIPTLTSEGLSNRAQDQINSSNINFRLSDYFTPGWADTRWQHRKNITIDSTKVSADLTNFPVYIEVYDTDLPQDAQASGNDIMFTDDTGSILEHEIELYERVYNTSHAHLGAWVKGNISSTQNTVLSMYYGNPIAENQENPTAVWGEDYVGVWHLSEASGNSQDSTSYGTNGTISGGVTQKVTGQLGRGYDFDGTASSTVNFGDPIDG
ncbi:MAG: DUF2341 domain-containing protein, partial [Candidatus Hodarchaeales archaeon]